MAFDDTWRWDEKAVERYEQISQAAALPYRDAIVGLHMMLDECGMLAYLTYMAPRLAEIRRVLKDTGSVYLHCDPTASHYLKLVMDAVFGKKAYRNEIVWPYPPGGAGPKAAFHRKHDTLFFYAKGPNNTFHRPYTPLTEKAIAKFTKVDADGRRYKEYRGKTRTYLDEVPGRPVPSVWGDIHSLGQTISKEKLPYPTQKPLALLERIIQASSDTDGLILDPFCGCGTTVDAANRLGRKWVGIDISPFAIDLVKDRRLKESRVQVHGVAVDVATAQAMASSQPFEFEKWAVSRVPGVVPNKVQVGDGGVDGRGFLLDRGGLVLSQVKGGKFSIDQLRAFLSVVEREKAAFGVFITVGKVTSPSAKREAAGAGKVKIGAKSYPKVQLWSIADHFDGREPNLPPLADPYTGKAMQRDILTGQ